MTSTRRKSGPSVSYRYVLIKLDRGTDDELIWERLKAIVSNHAGVARDRVTDEKYFVHDFRLD